MNLKNALQLTTKKFIKAKIKTADLDALVLLEHVLKKSKEFILAHPEMELTKKQEKQFSTLTEKRAQRFPLAYILGFKEFYGRKFLVNENVLIPRPETEQIIELALGYVENEILRLSPRNDKTISILDLGTGSGCIAITLAKELEVYPAFAKSYAGLPAGKKLIYQITASDMSLDALKVAKINAKRLNAKNVSSIHGDLFENINGKFDLIVTNLPYVKKEEIKNELKFEPRSALLDHQQIPQMLKEFKKYLEPKGVLIYETTNGKVKEMR